MTRRDVHGSSQVAGVPKTCRIVRPREVGTPTGIVAAPTCPETGSRDSDAAWPLSGRCWGLVWRPRAHARPRAAPGSCGLLFAALGAPRRPHEGGGAMPVSD